MIKVLHFTKRKLRITSTLLFLTLTLASYAQKAWIGGTGNWDDAAKWSPAGVPTATDVVNIAVLGSSVTIPTGVSAVAQAIVVDGSDLTISDPSSSLTVNGSTGEGLWVKGNSNLINAGILSINNIAYNALIVDGTMGCDITNQGTLNIGSTGAIGGRGIYLMGTTFQNAGNGIINIDGVGFDFALLATPTAYFNNYGEVTMGGVTNVSKGISSSNTLSNLGILNFGNIINEGIALGTTVSNNSSVIVLAGKTLKISGTLINNVFMYVHGTCVNNGTLENANRLSVLNAGTLQNNATMTNRAIISNQGDLIINSGKTLTINNGGIFTNEATGILTVNGTLDVISGTTLNNLGTIQGTGTIARAGIFRNFITSSFVPGNNIGTLRLTGTINLMGTMVDVEANGTTAGAYDVVSVNNAVTITDSSQLLLTLGSGYTPVSGDKITVLKSTALTGVFAPANVSLPGGWTVTYNMPATGDVTLVYNVALPIELLNFTAVNKGKNNLLTWQTAYEVNNKGFDVERRAESGDWVKLGFVKGNNSPSTYTFTDSDPLSIGQVSYYRLRQIDHNDKEEISKIVSVSNVGKLEAQVYPNPTHGKLIIQLANESVASVRVYNLVGQVVVSSNALNTSGDLDLSQLARGTYIVEIQTEGSVLRQKVVKN